MTVYRMRGGYTLTDKDFERLGAACEQGNCPGGLGEWIINPRGRLTFAGGALVDGGRFEVKRIEAGKGCSNGKLCNNSI